MSHKPNLCYLNDNVTSRFCIATKYHIVHVYNGCAVLHEVHVYHSEEHSTYTGASGDTHCFRL